MEVSGEPGERRSIHPICLCVFIEYRDGVGEITPGNINSPDSLSYVPLVILHHGHQNENTILVSRNEEI